MRWEEHTFVICAYGKSPYLENCIRSLKKQRIKSRILMITSTPNERITEMAETYAILLKVRKGESSLAADWNFAYQQAGTAYVTLAHQDDIYGPSYLQEIYRAVLRQEPALLLFTDYCELRGEEYLQKNPLLNMKRRMLAPLKSRRMQNSVWMRRRILSLGNPICCPAVTYAKCSLPAVLFQEGFSSNTDWDAWERLSRRKGAFIYVPKSCMAHRIHEASTTTKIIGDNRRSREDYEMFTRFWPAGIAALLERFYRKSEASNTMGE